MEINEYIGRQIRELREKMRLKQQDIASALQVSPQAVSKWERGENAPDISLLVPLAKLLSVSVDSLLGYAEGLPDVLEATVMCAVVMGYTEKAQTMNLRDLVIWTNGFFYQLTESVLASDGVLVKYQGDSLLCFFTGPDHTKRALRSALLAELTVSGPVSICLNTGMIFLGSVGHSEYARPDILGNTVNLTFLAQRWIEQHVPEHSGVLEAFAEKHGKDDAFGNPAEAVLPGFEKPVRIYPVRKKGV